MHHLQVQQNALQHYTATHAVHSGLCSVAAIFVAWLCAPFIACKCAILHDLIKQLSTNVPHHAAGGSGLLPSMDLEQRGWHDSVMAPAPSLPYSRDVSLTPLPAFPSMPAQPVASPFTSQPGGFAPPQQSMGTYGPQFAASGPPPSNGFKAAQPQMSANPMSAYGGGAPYMSPFSTQHARQNVRAGAHAIPQAQPFSSYAGTYAPPAHAAPPRSYAPQHGSVYAPSSRVYQPAVPPNATNSTAYNAYPQSSMLLQSAPLDDVLPAAAPAAAPPVQPQRDSPFAALAPARRTPMQPHAQLQPQPQLQMQARQPMAESPAPARRAAVQPHAQPSAQPQMQVQQPAAEPPAPGTQADSPGPRSNGFAARHAVQHDRENARAQQQDDAALHVKSGSGESESWHEDSAAGSGHLDTDDHTSPRAANEDEHEDATGEQVTDVEVKVEAAEPAKVRILATYRLHHCHLLERNVGVKFLLMPASEIFPCHSIGWLERVNGASKLCKVAGARSNCIWACAGRHASQEAGSKAARAARATRTQGDHAAQAEQSQGAAALP